jgi:hypothetical protein
MGLGSAGKISTKPVSRNNASRCILSRYATFRSDRGSGDSVEEALPYQGTEQDKDTKQECLTCILER